MSSPNPDHLLVLDLETTQTDISHPHATILEVGAVLVRWEPALPVVAEANLIVRPPGLKGDHDQMWAHMLPVVQDMHAANGLWEAATTDPGAWELHEADDAVTAWIAQHAGPGPVVLAGSGVSHLDVPFVRAFMPRLSTRVTYWSLDVGHVRRMLQLAGRDDLVDLAGDVDAKPHRALGDARLHTAELRRYLQVLQGAGAG